LYMTHEQAVGLLGQQRRAAAPMSPAPLGGQLAKIAERCGLDSIDIEVLIASMAPDVDPRFEKLYGFIHDDLTKRRATVGLAMTLCGLDPASPEGRARFDANGPLSANALFAVEGAGPFLGRVLTVPDAVVQTLLGGRGPETLLRRFVVEQVCVQAVEVNAVREMLTRFRLVHLTEGIGGAAAHIAASAARSAGESPLVVDLSVATTEELPEVVAAIARHQALTGDIVVVRLAEDVAERAPRALKRLADGSGRVVFVGTKAWDAGWAMTDPSRVHIGELPQADSERIWRHALAGADHLDGAVTEAARTFRLTPEQIVRAARAANMDNHDGGPLGFAELSAGARAQSASGLDRLARRLEPTVGWDDLILPDDVMVLLRELSLRVRHRETVMQQWELGRGWRGRGIAALFAGPSGTGKTTAAEVIARELGYDIHVVDLSSVVDKYIGETEKKLEVIFTEAERTNTVLLFDEADAIFGKRSEVKDARDRYANIEVSYLLQRIERFSGLAVLTTNLGANLDEAFTRRLDLVVDFPRPDAAARQSIWRHEFRPTVPTEDIDFAFCAAAFDLTGGNIRNIVITAAYLAADAQRPVGMADVVAAVQREYRKMGRLCLPGEFGRFAGLLR
jgi:hypothetical protein